MTTVKAYAKVNLYLCVGAKRPDGYHDVQTMLQAVNLHDLISFEESDSLALTCSDPKLAGDANLAWKAIRLIRELADVPNLHIHIEKRIPVQAGLGGGSSDAAAVLRELNRRIGGVPASELHSIASACGSDVPFFLLDSTRAVAAGRGDDLRPVCAPPASPIVIAKPEVGCDSATMYHALSHVLRTPTSRPEEGMNDFELVAPQESVRLIEELRELGGEQAMLCGSGSAVFARFSTPERAQEAVRKVSAWSVACATLEEYD